MASFKSFTLFITALILVNCSSSVDSSISNNGASTKIITLNNYNLTFNIPFGWNKVEDNYKKIFEVWLVSENNKSAIGLIPIHISNKELLGSEKDKLSIIESIVLNKKKTNADVELISNEMKNFNRDAIELRMSVDNDFQNSIIFGENDYYFECLAYFLEEYEPTDEEIELLLKDQAQFVTDCKLK